MDTNFNSKSDLVSVITSPLGFFALSLLIVEGFLTIVLIFSNLAANYKFLGMLIGASLFILVVGGVWYLVLKKPTNLTFGEKSWRDHEKDFGTGSTDKSKIDISKPTINII